MGCLLKLSRYETNFRTIVCFKGVFNCLSLKSSGLILQAARRMQINLDLKPNKAVNGMEKVPTMQFPVLWVEEVKNILRNFVEQRFNLAHIFLYSRHFSWIMKYNPGSSTICYWLENCFNSENGWGSRPALFYSLSRSQFIF